MLTNVYGHNEHLSSEMEPNNIKIKYAVCVKKNNVVIDIYLLAIKVESSPK